MSLYSRTCACAGAAATATAQTHIAMARRAILENVMKTNIRTSEISSKQHGRQTTPTGRGRATGEKARERDRQRHPPSNPLGPLVQHPLGGAAADRLDAGVAGHALDRALAHVAHAA